MGFYFGSELKLNIEEKEYSVDIYSKKIISVVEEIARQSTELGAKENRSKEDLEEYTKQLINFIDIITNNQSEVIFKDREISLEDLSELTAYILSEITQFKIERLKSLTKTEK